MTHPKSYPLDLGNGAATVTVEGLPAEGTFRTCVGGAAPREVRLLASAPRLLALVDGRVVALSLATRGGETALSHRGRSRSLEKPRSPTETRRPRSASSGQLTAPMPGRVVQIHIREGEEVAAGAPVIVIEAMKMQNALFAPRAGKVARVYVSEGDPIERGAKLVELSPSADGEP